MQNDDISRHFFHIFKILIFQAVRRVKEQKIAQNDTSAMHHISGTVHHLIIIFDIHTVNARFTAPGAYLKI